MDKRSSGSLTRLCLPLLVALISGIQACSSGSPCGDVCSCVEDALGSEARDTCDTQCANLENGPDPRKSCEDTVTANGVSSCVSACAAFTGSSTTSTTTSSSTGTSSTGPSCNVTATGCACTSSSTPNSTSCSASTLASGATCCADTGWPSSGACQCDGPKAKCGLDPNEQSLGFTCTCEYADPAGASYTTELGECLPGAGYCCKFGHACACYEAGSGTCSEIGGLDVSSCTPTTFADVCETAETSVASCSP